MSARPIEVFFYGLFMDQDLLRSKGARPANARAASVPGFALRIGNRATLVPQAPSAAHGRLMQLTHSEIEHLYWDPSVSAYKPEAVLARLPDDSQVPALCFNLLEAPAAAEHNTEYATRLRAPAARLQLPSDYVQSIQ